MRTGTAVTLHPWTHRHRPEPNQRSAGEEFVSSGVLLAIVNARGKLDARTVGPFARELEQPLAAGATRLLVDLSQVDDVAATCMNALLAARQQLVRRGGRIAVVLGPAMRRRFEALGLDRRFLLAADRMQAARMLGLADSLPPQVGAPRPHAHAA